MATTLTQCRFSAFVRNPLGAGGSLPYKAVEQMEGATQLRLMVRRISTLPADIGIAQSEQR